jgi:hypothetical protein
MTDRVSKETAIDIAMAYREIEAGEKLLADVIAAMEKQHPTDIRDVFGRRVDGLQLGVPNGQSGHLLYTVPWALAKPIIEAHIAQKQAVLDALSAKARIELSAAEIEANG